MHLTPLKAFRISEHTWFQSVIIILLLLGIFFRFFNLDHKVYWHDEAYTSIRAAGFTRYEIDQEIFQNQIISAEELQKFQQLKPGSTAVDTIRSLAVEDPQHPPLYFLMARFWMQTFGSSLTASRALPAILSLLALPFMYGLALELFASQLTAQLATALLALSPFDVLFAQTARQYSLLTVTVVGSSFFLLRALRLSTWKNWGLYALMVTIGLYTHPFFGLTLIGHGVLVLADQLRKRDKTQFKIQTLRFFLATVVSLVLYSPWLMVLKNNYQRISDTTDWTRHRVDFLYLVKLWILSFTALFLDLDFGLSFEDIWAYLPRLPIVLLIAVALYTVCRRANSLTKLFILTSIFVPFLMLVLPDLLSGGKRSAVSRYLISCYPGVQLAVAYFLVTKGGLEPYRYTADKQVWRVVLAVLVTGSIASCTVSAFADTWWDKDLSYFNGEITRLINEDAKNHASTSPPLVVSEIGDDFTNTGDLISMSYQLSKDVQLLLLTQPPNLKLIPKGTEPLVFRPSGRFYAAAEQMQYQLTPVLPDGKLRRLRR